MALVENGDNVMRGDGAIFMLFYLMFVAMMFIIARQVQGLAAATRALNRGGLTQKKVSDVCANLKRVFTTFGVVVLLFILLGIVTYLYLSTQYSYYY